MRIRLGYPDRTAEHDLLTGMARHDLLQTLQPVMQAADLLQLQAQVQAIHASEALIRYLQDLLAATRSGQWFEQGLSPRAGVGILRAAKARALLAEREFVTPDDVQAILPQTAAHRLTPVSHAGRGALEQVRAMMAAVVLA